METLPVWKRIFPVIASKNPHVTEDIVDDVLDICKENILDIFLQYEFYSKESFLKWKQNLGVKEIVSDDEMCNFIHNLSKKLNLNTNGVWTVLCNFLMYEYYGKVDELKGLIKFNAKVEFLMENIWYFYSGERMFLIKTLRHILESAENKNDTYYEKLHSFVKDISLPTLWKNAVKVFDNLIHEIGKDTLHLVPADLLKEWIHRNNREQLEVLLLLLQILQNLKITGPELENTISLFIRHGFARHPLYADSLKISKPEDLLQIKNAEIAIVLSILNKFWESPAVGKTLPANLERNLELLQIQGDNSIVMFGWSIFKLSCFKLESGKELESSRFMVEELLKKNVFEPIYELLTHRIFSNFKSSSVSNGIFRLIVEFLKIYDVNYFYQQPGAVKVVAELVNQRGIVILETLGSVFQLSMEAFPYVFEPFLELCKSLLSIPKRQNFTMKLLKALPTFLAEIPYMHRQSRYRMTKFLQLFTDSELFMIPNGTIVEEFVYGGNELSKFHFPFSFFLLMEQFTKSLVTIRYENKPDWHCHKNLMKVVQIGFQCIHHILKLYKGDYRRDVELRTLVQRLEIVPTQFCEEPLKNSNFILLYFSINCTLIKRELLDYTEAFPPLLQKSFMPHIISYTKRNRDSLFSQLHNKSLLYRALKDEENEKTHKLLIEYLELVNFMIEKNLYHHEIQLAGIWYILTNTFPLHQQWHYEDSYEQTRITKLCISMFIGVLKRHLLKIEKESAVIFEMVTDAFYHEEITVSSFMSVFSKDKFYLQNLLESEINWTNGPALESLECLRLQVVLLLLLYKHKIKMETGKNLLDDNVGFFAKAVTPYIINPYSLSLRKLSCKCLELLSRDENIPLMALLGLDYDQVQRLYLDRLRDSTEDDDLKLQILDLIGTCIIHQHGMTAAFFNVKRSRKWYSDNKDKTIEGDTVTDFMIDYLKNIKKSPAYLRSPLQIGILHIMTNLWSSRKRHLIDEVVNLDQFWPLLSNPWYREFDQLPKVYAYILKIYSIQLVEIDKDENFLSSIEKFITDKKQVKSWVEYLRSTFREPTNIIEEIEDRQYLLKSWTEFMIVLEKTNELKKFDDVNKFEFITMSLDGLTFPLVNTYCLKLWMDLVLLQISYWEIPPVGDSRVLAEKTINALSIIKLYYCDMEHSARLAVLTVIQEITENLQDYFQSSSPNLFNLLMHFGPMFDYEYQLVEEGQWKTTQDVFDTAIREHLLPWMMCVRIVSDLFKLTNIEEISCWFTYRNLIEKLMSSTCEFIQYRPTMSLAKVVIYSLALYAGSPLYLDFLGKSMNDFLVKLDTSITPLLLGHNNKINPMQLEEGWVTSSLFIQFLTAYFKSLQYQALPNCYTFIILSEHILGHIFNILQTTVALKALDLVINTLVLFDSMLEKWRLEWYRKSNATYQFVIKGVKNIVNACLYTILRPKNIIVHILDETNRLIQLEKYPVELMVAIVNRLVTAIGLGFSILYRINPGLTDLLDPYLPDTVVRIIENDFSVPTFELPISNNLTYGMLLCLAHFLCKTLDVLKLNKKHTTSSVPSEYFTRTFGMVEHQGLSDNIPTQKLSAFLRHAMYEYSGLADPWIQELDYNRVKDSLEILMMFLSQQIFLDIQIPSENSSYFIRNLSSELQFFYEHVKRMTSSHLASKLNSMSPSCQSETDILKKYLIHHKETECFEEVVDMNFCIIISNWFTNICKLK
ncbi:uncharacterized protein LOC130898159 [Diorhabda carinulata]|uniref:uncharacterized protein LOC130898159 n=1 Tax=Diorhabda carinulata TaxID=1163345 RepID=UPI0025A0C35B|nr:uncharacterized protein LOC130898159 [Diorhabda carinulata]